MAVDDVDRDAPSTLGASFPAQSNMRLRLLLCQPPTFESDNVQARTGDNLVFVVRAEDGQGRPIPYTTNQGLWSASSSDATPVLFMDPNSAGRYVAVNPGTATVFFNDLNDLSLSAEGAVAVTGAPAVVPGTIFFSNQPEGPQTTFSPLSPVPVVRVLDTNGSPMAGVNVTLEATGEGAGFISATRATDSTGAAGFGDFLLASPGTYTLIGRAAGLAFVGNSFEVTSGRVLVSLRILTADGTTVQAGRALNLRAEGTLSDGTVIDATNLVDWIASNQNARVTPTGLVSGVFAGSVTIEALQKAGAATRAQIDLTITPPPVRRRGLIYIADSGGPGSANGEILVSSFETSSGRLDKTGDTLNLTRISLTATGSFTAARPFDVLLNSDATRLIVGTDAQARVYEVNRTDGNLLLFSPGPSENNFPDLRHLVQSRLGGVTNRYYGVSEGTKVGAFTLNANGSLTRFRTWVMPNFVRGLESFQVGSEDFVYVNLGDSLHVINVATGADTSVAIPPNLILNPGLELTLPSGPVLSMGGFILSGMVGAPHLLTLPVDSSTGMPNPNQFTFVPTIGEPRGLTANAGDDLVVVGSFTDNLVDAFTTAKFPTNPTRFTGAPFASTGAPEALEIGGVSRELVFALTSPQGTLDVFKLQLVGAGFSLTRQDTARVGGVNVQDVESTVVGNQ